MKILLSTVILGALLANAGDAQRKAPAPGKPKPLEPNCRAEAIGVPGPALPSLRRTGPMTIAVTWDPSVPAAAIPVIQHAIDEWEAILISNGISTSPLPITVLYTNLSGNLLGLTTTTYSLGNGAIQSAIVRFDSPTSWFVDPTPWDDSEFDANGLNGPAGWDLLTTARHELGHAVGYLDTLNVQNLSAPSGAGGAGIVFDPTRCNIPWTTVGGGHTDNFFFPNDLMQPGIGASTRRWIDHYFHSALLSRAYQHLVVADFVDPFHIGGSNGSTYLPWTDFASSYLLSPTSGEVWIRPGTYVEGPLTLLDAKTLGAMRGGSVVIH